MQESSRDTFKQERTVAFIVARLGSSRLPGKQFRKIGRKMLLEWLLEELRRCRQVDKIVLATSAEPENGPLLSWSDKQGISTYSYPGGVNHVTTRLRRAAEKFSAEICVLVSGDCPLIHAPAIDQLVSSLKCHPEADFVAAKPDSQGHPPALQGISVARIKTWQRADDLSDRPALKEHHFPILHQRPDLFTCHRIALQKDLYAPFHHRYSIDTWADLEFHNVVHNTLAASGSTYSLPAVVNLLRQDQSLVSINSHVHQKGVGEIDRKVLMVVDAGEKYGYGHLMRSRELALQITERLGWSVTFLVTDLEATNSLEAVGLRVLPKDKDATDRSASLPMYNGKNPVELLGLSAPGNTAWLASYDLVILDLNCQNNLPPGWRQRLPESSRVVIIDRLDDWTREADLVIIPGVTGQVPDSQSADGKPEILAGRDYVILRREISRLTDRKIPKNIDLLTYLHHEWQRDIIKKFSAATDLTVHIIEGQRPDFHYLMARSRVFLSGFGVSFYEALALGTYPVTWAFSAAHCRDARCFYRQTGLREIVVPTDAKQDELSRVINQALVEKTGQVIEDGTSNIVRKINSLLKQPCA
ncbi:cytidylyltransferase domain-containing protein [Desulfolithobacter dissulfuricans]|uniref:cytidylyltransferase domain-containing protein n=1 Tax=Desulfolithobacter dissulfuricans TaxID=2795293 RepID=UPI002278BFA3|nr:NTP transferase domain-containing protein [Desulfolithobacter dissulfuricans]